MLFMRGPMLEKPCLTKPWSNGSQVWEYTRTSQNPLNQFGMCCPWEVPFWRNLEVMAAMFESLQDPKSHSNSSVCVVCERSFSRHLDKAMAATCQIKLQEAQDPWNIGEVLKIHHVSWSYGPHKMSSRSTELSCKVSLLYWTLPTHSLNVSLSSF